MKKTLLIFVLLGFVFLLLGCSSNEESNQDSHFYFDLVDQSWYEQPKLLRVGMDLNYPPFETITGDGTPTGISVDIAYAFARFIGRDVEIVNTDFGSLIPSIQAREIDIIIASMSITEQRMQTVDFSNPYFYFKIISLVNKDFAETHGLTSDSTKEELLAIDNVRYVGIATQVSASIPRSLGKDVEEATDLGTAIELVSQGGADVLLMSANPVVDGHKANPNSTIVLWDPFVSSPIGMAMTKQNDGLLNAANQFIETMSYENGLYDLLRQRWDTILQERLGRFGLDFYINES